MNKGYPIKFALLEIEEHCGWILGLNELIRQYEVSSIIVSPAYLVSSKTNYYEDGSSKTKYEVVFPFRNLEDLSSTPTVPDYNIYDQVSNGIVVTEIFETFDEAKIIAEERNDELRSRCMLSISFRDNDCIDKLHQVKATFEKKLNKNLELEERILKAFDEELIQNVGKGGKTAAPRLIKTTKN